MHVREKLAGAKGARNQTAENKAVVSDFIKKAVSWGDPAAAASLLSDNYVQHNPNIADGKDGFVDYFVKLKQTFPSVRGDIKRMIAEGDMVVVHMHAVRQPGDLGLAIVDIFRMEGKLIVEHWEVRQPVIESELHGNRMI
jgi:predicted SnoaL-like aldol condensation-catalyzing enzyme